jgi:hypothetical protein
MASTRAPARAVAKWLVSRRRIVGAQDRWSIDSRSSRIGTDLISLARLLGGIDCVRGEFGGPRQWFARN